MRFIFRDEPILMAVLSFGAGVLIFWFLPKCREEMRQYLRDLGRLLPLTLGVFGIGFLAVGALVTLTIWIFG